MRVVKLTSPTINSTTVSGPSELPYSSGTTYATGDIVSGVGSDGLTHRYESLQDDNTGNALTETAYWLDLGPTNAHKMFDIGASTETIDTDTIVVEVEPGERFDYVSVVGVYGCTSVTCVVETAGGTELYNLTKGLKDTSLGASSASWYEYFFGDKDKYLDAVSFDVNTLYTDAVVKVTLTKGTGSSQVRCATLAIGRSRKLGLTLDGVSIDREDYSTIETNQFGFTEFIKRPSAKRASVRMILNSSLVDAVNGALRDVGGEPAFFDLNNDDTTYSALTILGFYENFSIDLQFNNSYCTLSVLELL